MAHIKRFNEMVHHFSQYAEWLDRGLIQKVIDKMKFDNKFKFELSTFNTNYPVKNTNKFPSNMGKQVADWIDIDIVQDCVDRMNPHLSSESQSDDYKRDLEEFVL